MRSIDLFISHSSADTEVAESIVNELEKRGIACWYAPRDVPLGGEYQAEIVLALDAARAVLLIFSKNANASHHILREIELAVQDRKPVYPIRIDGTKPSHGLRYLLANKQWVDHKDPISGLANRIERLMRRSDQADDAREPPAPLEPSRTAAEIASPEGKRNPARRGLLLAASVGAVCLAIAGGWFALYGRNWFASPAIAPRATTENQGAPSPREPTPPQASAQPKEAPPPAAPPRRAAPREHGVVPPTGADTRRAFVVGVQRYADTNLLQLTRTVVDAQDLASDLEEVGFEERNITLLRDLKNRENFTQAYDKFLQTVEPGNTVVVSFSGHGFGVGENHFLLPGDVKSPLGFVREQLTSSERANPDIVRLRIPGFVESYAQKEIPRAGISLQQIVTSLAQRKPKSALLLMDACRPLLPLELTGSGTQTSLTSFVCAHSDYGGLPPGFLMLHSTSSGEEPIETFDPADHRRNSLFFEVLRSELQRPGQTMLELAERVQTKVDAIAERNGRQQRPSYFIGADIDEFRFVESVGAERVRVSGRDACLNSSGAWEQTRSSRQREKYLRLIRRFDGCPAAYVARRALALLDLDGEPARVEPVPLGKPISVCDRLAASPIDMQRPPEVPGVRLEKIDGEEAVAACTKATQDDPRQARFLLNLGRGYLKRSEDDLAPQDRERAIRSARIAFEDAAKRGYLAAYYHLALLIESTGAELEEAVKYLNLGAEKGEPANSLVLARYYREGHGVARDFEKAYALMARSAEAGFGPAMVDLGDALRTGLGLASNAPQRALDWYRRAAENGSHRAKMRLGASYLSGIAWRGFREADRKPSVAPDLDLALLWFGRAAMDGDAQARAQFASTVEAAAETLRLPEALAPYYWSLAAFGDNGRAQVMFAKNALGASSPAPANPRDAYIALESATVDHQSAEAALLLARIKRNGLLGETRDPQTAAQYAYRAIELAAQADPTEFGHNPVVEMSAAHLIAEMARDRELVGSRGAPLLAPEELERLEYFYGRVDPVSRQVKVTTLKPAVCDQTLELSVWNWGRKEAPTAPQVRAVNDVRDAACPELEALDKKLSDAFEEARESKGAFIFPMKAAPRPDAREKYRERVQRLADQLQRYAAANGGDPVTGSSIERALDKAYHEANLVTYERFAGEPWSQDRLRLMIVDRALADADMMIRGNSRGNASEVLSGLLGQSAEAIYRRVFELSELTAASRSALVFDERLREAARFIRPRDLLSSFAIVAASNVPRSIDALFQRSGDPFVLRYRAQRIALDCLTQNIDRITPSETRILAADEFEQRIKRTIETVCGNWLENQFVANGALVVQKPVPIRAAWSAQGMRDDPSMYGRP